MSHYDHQIGGLATISSASFLFLVHWMELSDETTVSGSNFSSFAVPVSKIMLMSIMQQ